MWRGCLPNPVCRMCPFLNLNLLVRPGSIFECRRLPIVAVLFVTVSLCLPNVAVAFAECGRRVCELVFRMCRHLIGERRRSVHGWLGGYGIGRFVDGWVGGGARVDGWLGGYGRTGGRLGGWWGCGDGLWTADGEDGRLYGW